MYHDQPHEKHKPLIVNTLLAQHSLSLNLKRNPAIRREVNAIEDLVKGQSEGKFAQPQVVPVPDNLDPSIPRLIFVSQAGFSQLMISQASVHFNVNYSPDWGADPDRCEAYLRSKVDLLFKIAEAGWGTSTKPYFAGITTTFGVPAESQADAVAKLASLFTDASMLTANANELSCRWSLKVEDHFYNNIAIATQVRLSAAEAAASDGIPRFSVDTIEAYGIEVAGDYNDRLAYNLSEAYRTAPDTVLEMISAGCKSAREIVARFDRDK